MVRELSDDSLARLAGELYWLKHGSMSLARYPKEDVLCALRSCAQKNNVPVGVTERTPLDYYINVGRIASNGEDLAILACALCQRIREKLEELHLRPTLIAIPRTCTIEFGRRVAQLLGYPVVYVDPNGPNGQVTVEGNIVQGNQAILVHDVVVSGYHLVNCVVELRKHGAQCKHLFALVHYHHPERAPYNLLSCNDITFHPVETIQRDWFAFLDQ
jgi:orotate phosphoribosyltransferase